jgi:tetratricopeptide (TPR) repeat protein
MAFRRDAVLASAERFLARGKFDAALKEYQRILDENPNDILALNKAGDIYALLNRAPDSIPYFKRIAEHYARDGFFLKAIAIYKKINKLDPARLEVYNLLADLYYKQGLLPDARAQYQILAEYHLKQNQMPEAIEVYKKMAQADPNDIKTPVKLADLLTSVGQTDQALMQYGVVGSMLAKRGAIDEAVAVYQKALTIRPGDAKVLSGLIRSMIEGGQPEVAIRLLRAQPRNAANMLMLAEVLAATDRADEAFEAGEAAVAFDSESEGPRLLLSALLVKRRDTEKAYEILRPLVDRAVRAGEVRKAIGLLQPLAESSRAPRLLLDRMVELRRLTGERPRIVESLLRSAEERERRGEQDDARQAYLEVLDLEPENARARMKAGAFAPEELSKDATPAPAAADESAAEIVVEFDEEAIEGPAAVPAGPPPPPPGPIPAVPPSEQQWKEALLEAEVFAKYGLVEKAAERYRRLLRGRPDEIAARRRLVELLSELSSPALAAETGLLAEALRRAGRPDEASAVERRHLGGTPAGLPVSAPPVPAPAAEPEPAPIPMEFDDLAAPPAPAPEKMEMPPAVTDLEITLDADLGHAIQEEMAKVPSQPPPGQGEGPSRLDETGLFSDEQKFFDLAAELERELEDESVSPAAPPLEGEDVSLEQIFREFKKGVEQQLSAEDYETHYNLGIAYKEMGLLDEAIGEFQIAAKDPARAVECCSMLGLCFLEKGLPQLAIEWFSRGLRSGSIREEERYGLMYDLAGVYEDTGDGDHAYQLYLEIYGANANYRDVAERIKDYEQSRGD